MLFLGPIGPTQVEVEFVPNGNDGKSSKHPQFECKYPILLSRYSIWAIALNHSFLTISSINVIIIVFIGKERSTNKRRQINPRYGPTVSGNPEYSYGWNIGWSPSIHPNPYVWRFPHDSIASISTGASFRFMKWENVLISGVEALNLTGKYNLKRMLLVGQI